MSSWETREFLLNVNGCSQRVSVAPATKLLLVLRNELGLNGPKYGCGLGECGACTVLIDGVAARACVLPIAAAAGREVLTLEWLGRGNPDGLDTVQRAFIAAQAAQCGYCLNGMIMTMRGLLNREPHPSPARIVDALRYNLCRCGTHVEILRACLRAADHDRAG